MNTTLKFWVESFRGDVDMLSLVSIDVDSSLPKNKIKKIVSRSFKQKKISLIDSEFELTADSELNDLILSLTTQRKDKKLCLKRQASS